MKQFKMNERQRFSIRKFSIGAASVLLGSVFFVANPATEVQAAEANTEVVSQDGNGNTGNPSVLPPSDTSNQNLNVEQEGAKPNTQATERKEQDSQAKDGEGKAKSTVENTGDEKVDGVVKPVSGESSPVFEEEKDKKEVQPELEEETVSIGRRSKLAQSQDRSVENQEEKSVASSTSYINGEGSYSLSDDIHKLLQNLKNSAGNQEQVQKLNEAYEKFNAALGISETGLVDQEIFNAALEEYRKASQLQQGEAANLDGNLRHSRETSSLRVGLATGRTSDPQYSTNKVVPVLTGEAVGNNVRLIAESLSGRTITNIDVQGLDGLGLTKSSLKTIGSRGYVDLTGRIPGNKHGLSNIVVTATDSAGHSQHTTVSIARPLPTPRFTTTSQDLEGKSNEKPVVSGTIGTKAEPNNLPSDAELKAYLVTGGRQNPYSFLPEADGYHVVAEAPVKTDGSFDFVPPKYSDQTKGIGTDNLRLVVAYVHKGTNTTYYEGLKTDFSANSIKATAPVDKQPLIQAKSELEGLTSKADPTVGKTTSTASAYKTAKQEALNEIASATRVIEDQNATSQAVSDALRAVGNKKTALTTAESNLKTAATSDALKTLKNSADALVKANLQNKTPNSVKEYETKFNEFSNELNTAKTEALRVVSQGSDATAEDAQSAQTAVQRVKAKLDAANAVLREQADKSSLIQAKSELEGLTSKADPTVGKTTSTASAYKTAKQEALNEIASATRVIEDQNATSQAVSDEIEKLKSAMKKLQEAKDGLRDIQIPSHSTEEPTQPDQGGTETPTAPSEPAPQPSQPTAPGQSASPAPAPSSAPTQAPRAAASASASSTNTQAPAQEQVDKSELRALTQELDQRLKALATVSDPKIDAAKAVLLDAQKALEDSALTEQGLRTAVESVKAALDSLKDVKANASDSKPAQDKKDAKQGTEDSKDSDKMTETNSVPAGVIVVSLLALLGVIAFWLVRRKKESEIQQLSTELTKVLGQLDAEKADKKVLAKAKKLLQETLDFVKEENGSAETEAKLVEELKAILAKLK